MASQCPTLHAEPTLNVKPLVVKVLAATTTDGVKL
nr:MAG TPA: hypothetical protein [Caudoviricetes sp.]